MYHFLLSGIDGNKNRLFFTVKSSTINNAVGTAVQVGDNGQNDQSMNTNLRTSVTVRAPYTNALILVIIGILLVLTGLVAKIYMKMNKKHR